VAFGADEGLALARQYTPDAILLDMRLPDHSGLTVLQRLKEMPRPATSRCMWFRWKTGEAALHMGAIGYAVKPTTREQLKEVFRRLEAKLTQKIKRVLLVEDDDRQRDSMVQLIGDDDVEITAVGSGQDALALLRTTIYDCMIIDLKLPDMQGNELLNAWPPNRWRLPAGDRLHRPQPDARGRSRPAQVLALHHHQGRAFAGAPAGRSDAVPAQGGIAAVQRTPAHAQDRAPRDRVFEAAASCWWTTTCATSSP
jgi:DNA-binding response OmpR family regulator